MFLLLACTQPEPANRPPNVILVALDTVRWGATSFAGLETTPNLTALAELPGATTYSRAWAPAAWSLPSYVSLFTGQSVRAHQVGFSLDSLGPGQATLAEMLGAYGYSSAAFCSGPHLDPLTGVGRGFAAWNHQLSFSSMAGVVDPALEWAGEQTEPFLLFVQGYDAHVPYPAPSAIAEHFEHGPQAAPDGACGDRATATCPSRVTMAKARGGFDDSPTDPREVAHRWSHYQASVYSADHQMGRLLYGLDQLGLLEDSIVVAFSDHGELFGDQTGGDALYHVPLIIRMPTELDPTVDPDLVSLTDVLPTLAEELGLVPPAGIDGVPLAGREVLIAASATTYSVRDADWELELKRTDPEKPLLRLAEGSTEPVLDHPEAVEELQAHLEGWPLVIEGEDQSRHGPNSPKLRDALRKGGYWTPPPPESP